MTLTGALGMAVLCAAMTFILRESKSPLAPFACALGGITLLLGAFSRLSDSELIGKLSSLFAGEESKTVFKVLSIGLLTEICADTCEELGSPTLAKRLVFFGNAEILLLVFPILLDLFSLAGDMLL